MSSQMPEFKLETNDLYTEETFTDRRVGSIRRLQPVTADEFKIVTKLGTWLKEFF